jgi:ferredoxin, 2Fe-2S
VITVNFIRTNKEKVQVKVPEGWTVMEAAKQANLEEIPATCMGCCACATCHVYVNNAWIDKLGEIDYNKPEQELLEYEKGYKKGISRLGCQIYLTKELDNITLHLRDDELL